MTAYVPQRLSLPDGYTDIVADYCWLLKKAVQSGKPLLIVDEPQQLLSEDEAEEVDRLLGEAVQHGTTVLAVNDRITENRVSL